MPVIKVWNQDRSLKKIIQADSLSKVIKEGSIKLNYDEKELFNVVFESDGTEVDTEEIFQSLVEEKMFPETTLMLIPINVVWNQATPPCTSQQPVQPPNNQFNHQQSVLTPNVYETDNFSNLQIPVIQPPTSNTFDVPWEQFPTRLLSSCEKDEIPDPCLVRKMIRKVSEAITKFTERPERSFIRLVAQTIVNKYPVLGNPNNGTGKNFETIFVKIENCVQNLKRPVRLQQQSEIGDVKKRRAKKDEYGCVAWQPILPENETPDLQEEKRKWLIESYNVTSTNHETISFVMEKTFPTQRATINSKAIIQDIKESWPYLFSERYFFEHSSELLGFDVKFRWNTSLEKVPGLISYFRTLRRKNEAMDKILIKIEEAVVEMKSRTPEVSCLLLALCTYFGEKKSEVVRYFEETTSLIDIQQTRRNENLVNPTICILGKSIFYNEAYVFIEDSVVGDIGNAADLLPLFFASFYVFNIHYPVGAEATLEFLQREFFNIIPDGHRRGGKKKRTVVHPKVSTLQLKLQHRAQLGLNYDEQYS